MSWREPFTGWNTTVSPQESDFNRIEGNTEYLKDAVDTEVTDREAADNVINARTPQSYKTTDDVIFNNISANGTITDKNGREVLALETEYKTTTTSAGTGMKSGTFTFSGAVRGVASLNCAASNAVFGSGEATAAAYTISGSTVTWSFYEPLSGPTRRVSCTAFI